MSLAPAAYLLYQRIMRHDPMDPAWTGRDRFVLSCGHSSLTLYIQLYLSGYGLTLDDLKAYRSWGSLTPGHPEHGLTPGVETTTGPLGQGLGNAVGMAMAARRERGLFDPDTADGREPVRPPHLRVRLGRGHGRGHHPRGLGHRGRPGAGQPDRLVRRQPHLDRGRHRHRQGRGHRRPLRGLRLARPAARLGHAEGLPRGRPGPVRRVRGGQGRDLPPVVHLAADDHRLARPEQAGHRRGPRLGPGRRRGGRDQEDPGLRPGRQLPARGQDLVDHAREVLDRGRAAHAEWTKGFDAWAGAHAEQKALFDRLASRDAARTAGPRRCRSSRPTPRAWPPARPPARC